MKRALIRGVGITLLALPPLALHTAATVCLRMVTKPKRWSAAGMRAQEIENGFGDCVEAYEKRWARESFSSSSMWPSCISARVPPSRE